MKSWGIRTRVLFLALLPVLLISSVLGTYFIHTRVHNLTQSLWDRGQTMARQLAPASQYGAFSGNKEILQKLAEAALGETDVRAVTIMDREDVILAHAGPRSIAAATQPPNSLGAKGLTGVEHPQVFVFWAPILIDDVSVEDYPQAIQEQSTPSLFGWVRVELSRETTIQQRNQAILHSVLIMFLGLGLGAILALKMGRDVTNPILKLTYAVERIKHGGLETCVNLHAGGELAILADDINSMAKGLASAHREMQHKIDQATCELRKTLAVLELKNQELEQARQRALQASQAKSTFLATMSHEIRTPMNGVLGFTDLLLRTRMEPKQQEYLQIIHNSASDLVAIINDILDLSKIEAGKLTIAHKPFNLADCVDEVLTRLAPDAHRKDIELISLVYSDVPLTLLGDPVRIRQVLTNLTSNAIKFTTHGSVAVRVMLEDQDANSILLKVTVTDTGTGLTEQQQRDIFSAFAQAGMGASGHACGTGLGLTISKCLVEKMGGQIQLESEVSKGSTFWFTLRCGIQSSFECEAGLLRPLTGSRTILYEDHRLARLATRHLLQKWQIQVAEVDALEALDKMCCTQNALGYLDFIILGLSGYQLGQRRTLSIARRLCQAYPHQVVALANTAEPALLTPLEKLGMIVLSKPVKRRILRRELERLSLGKPSMELCPNHQPASPVYALQGIRCLLADDHRTNLCLCIAMLEHLGIEVTAVSDGVQALKQVAEKHFDIILMDIQMPVMGGIEAVAQIRRWEANRRQRVPIIALTAHALENEREDMLQVGFDDFLIKPITLAELTHRLAKWACGNASALSSGQLICPARPAFLPSQAVTAGELAEEHRDLSQTILHELKAQLPNQIKRINRACKSEAWEQARREVHRLHGAICYAQAPKLRMATARLEAALKDYQAGQVSSCLAEFNIQTERFLRDNPIDGGNNALGQYPIDTRLSKISVK